MNTLNLTKNGNYKKVPIKLIRLNFPEIDYFVNTNKVQQNYIFRCY